MEMYSGDGEAHLLYWLSEGSYGYVRGHMVKY
jgi:hypothetical protein